MRTAHMMMRMLMGLKDGIELEQVLDPKRYLIFVPAITATSALSNVGPENLDLLVLWVVANLFSFALIFGIASFAAGALSTKTTGLTGLFVIGAMFGGLKSFLTFLAVQLMTSNLNLDELALRTITSLPLGIPLVFLVALVIRATENYQVERDLLISHRISVLQDSDNSGSALARLRVAMLRETAQEIRKVRQKLSEQADPEELGQHAKELRILAEYTVRPLSHQIWNAQAESINDFSFRQLFRLGLSSKNFSPIGFTLLAAPGLFIWLLSQRPIAEAGMTLAIVLVVTALTQALANLLVTGSFSQGLVRLIATNAISAAAGALLIYPGVTPAQEPELPAMFFALLIWFTSNSILLLLLKAGFNAQATLRDELERVFGKHQLERVLESAIARFEARRVAHALHSDVQNKLLSTALQLETNGALTKAELEAELGLIEGTVLELAEQPHNQPQDLLEATWAVISQWQGFLEIALSHQGNLETWNARAQEIGQAIGEALSNAKRHGGATKVEVALNAAETQLEIFVKDNGERSEDEKPGLGFALFSSLTRGQFQIDTKTQLGTTLSLRIPLTKGEAS